MKVGTRLHTSIGLVEIKAIHPVREKDISHQDARAAGFNSREELLNLLSATENGEIYKLVVGFYGEDPRLALRAQTALSETELAALVNKLDKLDKYSKEGPWTRQVLKTIQAHSHLRAVALAQLTGFEKDWLKINIRKLKNLGLTISHAVGYELSPKGKVVLNYIGKS